ncbi:cytochrome P460 family protein [uncultured Tateyamaria sp.]|uniref:cytochrome P460 family protein n=1 Tax=uncultured Tateyamaria sp. TaxID=455651 RepID=UPI0026218177|nr:cytochrome P460 family protein [uncultured Tateyamaria sp.]
MKTPMILTAVLATTAILVGGYGQLQPANAQQEADWKPVWTADGELQLPTGYREWVYLGSPLTPNALNGGAAGFPEYHNVYMHPEVFKIYQETKVFPEGTILLKELQLTLSSDEDDGSSYEVSGRGYFPGPYNGIDIAVKDSTRFSDSKNWGYFNFGHHAPPYAETAAAAPTAACAQCHIDNASADMVFTKFYQILDAE